MEGRGGGGGRGSDQTDPSDPTDRSDLTPAPAAAPPNCEDELRESYLGKSTVRLEFWMADRLGLNDPGPVVLEETLQEEESLRGILTRIAPRFGNSEALFDPETQSLSSEVTILMNGHVDLPQGLDTRLQDGDRVLFLPILAGG